MLNFPKYSHCTLLFIHQGDKILLGLKKRGFGANLWNGFGGKVDQNESVRSAAIREMEEECGVTPISPAFVGIMKFNMLLDQKTIIVHIFKSSEYTGEIKESEEMRPQWFKESEVDFNQMWPDDKVWYPDMIANKLFIGECSFQEHSNMTSQNHKVVSEEELLDSQKELSKIRLD